MSFQVFLDIGYWLKPISEILVFSVGRAFCKYTECYLLGLPKQTFFRGNKLDIRSSWVNSMEQTVQGLNCWVYQGLFSKKYGFRDLGWDRLQKAHLKNYENPS